MTGIGTALTQLESRWKQIDEEWSQRTYPFQISDLTELQGHMDTLQTDLASLLVVKNSIKQTLGKLREKMTQIKVIPPTLEEQLKTLDSKKADISKQMYDMCIDDHFMSCYMACLDDYRIPNLPLPYGFICHRAYQNELDILKTCLTETKKDLDARQELLQAHQKRYISNLANGSNASFSYFSDNTTKQLDEEEKNLITSINQGMDRHRNLQIKLYTFLDNFKPLNTPFFHFKCQALLKEKMDVMERSRCLQMELQESLKNSNMFHPNC